MPHILLKVFMLNGMLYISPLVVGHRAVGVAVKLGQMIHIVPHLTVTGMKNVRAITMHMNAFCILTIQFPPI